MSPCGKFYCGLFLFLLASASLTGQTRADLEKKKKQLQQEIEMTSKLISETQKNKTLSLSQLKALNRQLETRQRLIRAIESEVKLLNHSINTNDRKINDLQNDLRGIKSAYARLVRQAYINRSRSSTLVVLLSSGTIHQAYKRLYYIRVLNEARRNKAKQIRSTQLSLSQRSQSLRSDLDTKRVLLGSEVKEKQALSRERTEQEQTVNQLKKKENQLKKDLEKKQSDSKKLSREIQRVIEREIAKERERAEAASRKTAEKTITGSTAATKPADPELRVSPETRALSGKFEANRGKLPWPVEKGVITESFGMHPHPVLRGITTYNNGIDIVTTPSAPVRAIYEGEVSGIISIPGANTAVIIRHGEYLTVYSNLASVSVSKGDKVKTGQTIGTAAENSDGKAETHLEVWKGKTKLDPAGWIAR